MNVKEAQQEFVQLWGNFGSQWGINKTMAQVHALLLTSDDAMSTDDIMEALSISRGGANMNVRELMVWNLIYKVSKTGDRKEFFVAEKDIWEVAKRITRERKRREIEPLKLEKQYAQLLELTPLHLLLLLLIQLENLRLLLPMSGILLLGIFQAAL